MPAVFSHVENVERLIAAGYPAPPEWVALATRFHSRDLNQESCAGRYVTAIVKGTKADLPALKALALAEIAATPQETAQLSNLLAATVGDELVRLYAPHAEKQYQAVSGDWSEAGQRLLDLSAVIDPETPGDAVVSQSDTIRQAWSESMFAASRLEELMPVMIAAAQLAGAEADRPESIAPLLVSTQAVHRRRFWEAWNTTGRCGRWAKMLEVGAVITAHPSPSTCPEYGLPTEPRETWERDAAGHRRVMVDDADAEYLESHKALAKQ
jgi:hypothetical protein